MGSNFSPWESRALFGLLTDSPTDIVLKTDRKGFIVDASGATQHIGMPLSGLLIGPHLLDLVHPSHAHAVGAQFQSAFEGALASHWLEFLATASDCGDEWFEIRTRHLAQPAGRIYGTISVMRTLERRKS